VRLLHRAAWPPARLILISRRPILISRTPLSRQFLQGHVVADAECVTSKIRWLGPLCICVRREIDQVITAAKSGIGTFPTSRDADLSPECRPKRTSANHPESIDSRSQPGQKLRLLGSEFFR
jgi:hypothetical protein